MSGSNQFLPIATGGGANALTPAAYAALTTLLANGYQSGTASSTQINTTLRQSSFVAAAVAQLIADVTGFSVLDNGVIANFESQLAVAMGLLGYGLDTGTANAYIVTFSPAELGIYDGLRIRWRALNANTGASTLNINGLGNKPIWSAQHAALISGEIVVGGEVEVVWNASLNSGAGAWVLLECTGGAQQLPAGSYGSTPSPGDNSIKIATTAFIQSLMSNLPAINSGYLYGNRVINGAQEIDQANSGAAQTPAAGNAYLTDMFGASISQSSKLTFQQVTDAPAGLLKSLKITVAAQFAPAATDYFQLFTLIEGKDVIDFQLGTSGAATITLSNWIKGSVAGTYAVALVNSGLNRSYVGTVSVTTSWTQVKITLQGDVTGTWLTDNTIGLRLYWDLGSGSNFNTTAGAWQAGQFNRTSGSVTFVNQVAGSTLNITGVDCRLGSVAPTYFERRANELQLAQRYYELIAGIVSSSAATNVPIYYYKVTKRATPTLSTPIVNAGSGATIGTLAYDTLQGAAQVNANSALASLQFTASARLF